MAIIMSLMCAATGQAVRCSTRRHGSALMGCTSPIHVHSLCSHQTVLWTLKAMYPRAPCIVRLIGRHSRACGADDDKSNGRWLDSAFFSAAVLTCMIVLCPDFSHLLARCMPPYLHVHGVCPISMSLCLCCTFTCMMHAPIFTCAWCMSHIHVALSVLVGCLLCK